MTLARSVAFIGLAMLVTACGTTKPRTAQLQPPTNPHEGGYYKIGQPYMIDGVVYTPAEDWTYDETGIASWYGPDFHGKRTANGELYDMNEVTGAHRTLPMPCLVRVTNLDNGRSIVVRVNDRGPFARGRILDMSRRGAQLLGYERVGTAKVRVQILARESEALADAARAGKLATNLPGVDPNAAPPPVPGSAPTVASVEASPLPPSPPAVPVVDERAVLKQDVPGTKLAGASDGGRFIPAPKVSVSKPHPTSIYIQAGSFSVADNAQKLRDQLSHVAKTDISPTMVGGKPFYRVRIGPIASVDEADQLLNRVVGTGVLNAKIVVD